MELLALIPTLVLAGLLVWREIAHDRQVQGLLDRIQAPEIVVSQRAPEPSDEPLYLPFGDDEAYEDAVRNGEVT